MSVLSSHNIIQYYHDKSRSSRKAAVAKLSSLKPELSPEVFARASMLLKLFTGDVLFMLTVNSNGLFIEWNEKPTMIMTIR